MNALPSPFRFRSVLVALPLAGASALAHAATFKLPDSDTSLTVGGYVKLDAIRSDKSAGVDSVGDQQLNPNLIPVGASAGAHKTDQVTFHARQSRLFFGSTTPTSYGELNTYIEGDFFGDINSANESSTNGNGFRVRLAWGSLGNFGAGQYWTNLMNQDAYPETVDFGGAVGEIFVRQAQVRWTQPVSFGDWSVSAENPESVLAVPGSATTFRSDSDHVPDLTARVKFAGNRGTYTLGVLARQVRVDAAAPAAKDARWGGAIAATGIIAVGERDDLRFDLNAGNAIGRYQNGAFLPDGYLDTDGQLQLAQQRSGFAAYRHFWTPTLRSSVVLAAAESEPPAGTFGAINKSDRSQHLNLIWSPVKQVNLGGEVIHARRTVTGGDSGTLNRLQFAAQYLF